MGHRDQRGCLTVLLDLIGRIKPTPPLVGSDRKLLVVALSHIYVDPAWSETKRNAYSNTIQDRIPALFDEANKLMDELGLNTYVVPLHTKVVANAEMLEADLDFWGARGTTGKIVGQVAKSDPEHLHVHWSQRSTSAVEAVGSCPCGVDGSCNYVILTNRKISALTLVHELGHYFGYGYHHPDQSNFMHDPQGLNSTPEQIAEIWADINKYRRHLSTLSFAV